MKYAFFGSPQFAATILERLINAGLPPALVVANPDRPAGRKKVLTPPKTKVVAAKHGIPVWQPEKLDYQAKELSGIWDAFVVAAYAKIIPKAILEIPRLGSIGVHPSLLPKYRGATPIQSAILAGEKITGTSIFILDEAVDHGPILAQNQLEIAGRSYAELESELAKLSGELLTKILPDFFKNKIKPAEQNHSLATFTKKFSTEDGFVDVKKDAPELIESKIRALNPEPGVYTFIEKGGKKIRVKLLDADLVDGKLKLKLIQLEGKKPSRPESLPQP